VLVESPDSTRHSRGNCVPVDVHGYEWKHIGQHKHLGAREGQRQWTVDRGVTRLGNDSAAAPASCPVPRRGMRVFLQKVALRTGKQPGRAWVEHALTVTAWVRVRPIPRMGECHPKGRHRRGNEAGVHCPNVGR
jgi:hypothetical protein